MNVHKVHYCQNFRSRSTVSKLHKSRKEKKNRKKWLLYFTTGVPLKEEWLTWDPMMKISTLKARLTNGYINVQPTLTVNSCDNKRGKDGGSLTQFGVQGREILLIKTKFWTGKQKGEITLCIGIWRGDVLHLQICGPPCGLPIDVAWFMTSMWPLSTLYFERTLDKSNNFGNWRDTKKNFK